MAKLPTLIIKIEADTSDFRDAIQRVLVAVEELDAAIKVLNDTPVSLSVGDVKKGLADEDLEDKNPKARQAKNDPPIKMAMRMRREP